MKTLTSAERRALRARAHALHPTVMIGNAGLTGPVLKEIDLALKNHELIKIRMLGEDRDSRDDALERICGTLAASPVQLIGKILVVFRPRPEETPAETSTPPAKRGAANIGKRKRTPRRDERQFTRRRKSR